MSKHEYLDNKFLERVIAKFQQCKKDKIRYEAMIEQLRKFPEKTTINPVSEKPLDLETCLKEYAVIVTDFDLSQSCLATSFYMLSENIVIYAKTKWGPSAFNLTDEDDAVQEGVMICFDKIDRFNPSIGKAFNYMTTCILNHYRQLYRTARNYNELKKKYHTHLESQIPSVTRSHQGGLRKSIIPKENKDN